MIEFQLKSRQLYWSYLQERIVKSKTLSTAFKDELQSLFLETERFKEANFTQFELSEILVYLQESHAYYLNVSLPKIENTMQQLCVKFREEYLSLGILSIFIEKYKTELKQHIDLEEKVLFQFVERLLNGEYSKQNKDFVFNHFLHTHNDNVLLHLVELKQDLMSLDPELKGNLAFEVLFDQLDNFQFDLMIHGLIEDTIFINKILEYTSVHFERNATVKN